MEPPRKRHKGNEVIKAVGHTVPTKEKLLECITNCVAQYLCQDLETLITEYAHVNYLEIITKHELMHFDGSTRKWTLINFSLHVGLLCHVNGKLYAVGSSMSRSDRKALRKVYYYNIISNQWTPVASMNTARRCHSVEALNGKLYAVGGHDGSNVLSGVECYDDVSNQWTLVASHGAHQRLASMNTTRATHGVGVLNGKLYAVGGFSYHGKAISSVECYDDSSNQWTPVASMNTTRGGPGVGVLNGKLYAVGGYDCRGNVLSSVECYDDISNQWTTVASMNTTRCHHGVGVFKDNFQCPPEVGKLYIAGGGNLRCNQLHTVECYDDAANMWTVVPEMATPTTHSKS